MITCDLSQSMIFCFVDSPDVELIFFEYEFLLHTTWFASFLVSMCKLNLDVARVISNAVTHDRLEQAIVRLTSHRN